MYTKVVEAIRRAAPPAIWGRGVKLCRDGEGVVLESQDKDELVLRVRAPGVTVAPTVVIYPGELEWDCDCEGRMRPCEHITAAAIALSQTDGQPAAMKTANTTGGRLVYRFTSSENGLMVERFIANAAGEEKPLVSSLAAMLSKPSEASLVHPEEPDLRADRVLESRARGVLAADQLRALIAILADAPRVFLDGNAVSVSAEEVLPFATIKDEGHDVVLTIAADPRVKKAVATGVVLCASPPEVGTTGTLALVGESELCGARLQNLPSVQRFSVAALGELKTRIVPDLETRMKVQIQSQRLPRVTRDLAPRIQIELNHLGTGLSAMATLVYGDPPCARIDEGRMVHLSGPVPVRDEVAERKLLLRLREELDLLPGRRVQFQNEDATRFAARLARFRGELKGDAAREFSSRYKLVPRLLASALGAQQDGPPQLSFQMAFDVVGAERGGDTSRQVDAPSVLRAWEQGLGLVPLQGGGFAPLPLDFLEKHGARLAALLAARDDRGHVAGHALADLAQLCDDLNAPKPAALKRLTPLFESFDRLPPPQLPSDLQATLRPYQKQGVSWLQFLRTAGLGGVLADDMGLGKTLQTLCALKGRTLIVCPTSVVHNWRAECQRFRPSLKLCVYHGRDRKLDESAEVTLTSYSLMRLDQEILQAVQWDTIVLDEAQAIKNPESQAARAACALPAVFRLALTGTPVENRLDELWSLMHFTNRGLLGGRSHFADNIERPIVSGDQAAVAKLRARIKPFVMRRLKRDVAPDLPPRTESVMHVELDEKERGIYDTVRAAAQKDVIGLLQSGHGVMAALEALLRLRQASCHSALIPGQTATSSSKVERLVDALSTVAEEGGRSLVFSQWTSFLDLIEVALKEAGVKFCRLDGSTRDRDAVVKTFQDPAGPPVMLISLKAGGSGLNLTAADHVFICDPWWNPAVEAQAADRAHRIGQDKPVFVYRLVAVDTVEARILDLQERKRALADAALDGGAAAASLTKDDLLALLADA
ncbi:MAG: DEAD/DEAH box helicase [Deltaproteobacteria bacterium]|nr:DEAD/DEAH box helicase [Deltaproteobacteria bacterium]